MMRPLRSFTSTPTTMATESRSTLPIRTICGTGSMTAPYGDVDFLLMEFFSGIECDELVT